MAEKTVKRMWEEGLSSGGGPRKKVWPSAPAIKGVIAAESDAKIRASRLAEESMLREATEKQAKALAIKERESQEEELLKLSRLTIRSGLIAGVKAAPILHAMVGWAKNTYCVVDADGGLRIKDGANLSLRDITGMIDKFGLLATRMTVAADTMRKLGIQERDGSQNDDPTVRDLSDEELQEQLDELGKWFGRRAHPKRSEGGQMAAPDGPSPSSEPAGSVPGH